MSATPKHIGSISWTDLTVPNAGPVRDFYLAVVGWTHTPVAMDGYDDFCMNTPADGATVAGICHRRGPNADFPAQWLIYITLKTHRGRAATKEKLNHRFHRFSQSVF